VRLLTDAARAGHTVLPVDLVLRSVDRPDVDAALADGSVIEVEWHQEAAVALVDVAETEELLADGLAALAAGSRLAVVVGPDPAGRRLALARSVEPDAPTVVLDEAHRLGLDEALAAVEDLPEDSVLVIALDSAMPLAPVPGAIALDLAAARICPVLVGDPERDSRALGAARSALAAGSWPAQRPDDRSFVVVATSSPDEALLRVGQLVATSIPRAFELGEDAIAVLTLAADGAVGVEAVRAALSTSAPGVDVLPVAECGGRTWPATVLVLPGIVTSAMTRAAVYGALRAGVVHVSVVHGFAADPAPLVEIMAATTDRPRRTRLPELLTT
jgi:hypothetical protein